MDDEFWKQRWQRGEIGFHRSEIHWALKRHWVSTAEGSRAPVLVPLCGKSLDLRWLARAGHRVVGIELSAIAAAEFFAEWGRSPQRVRDGAFIRWRAGGVEILQGDFFAWRSQPPFELFYDRAALIALPAAMRRRYLDHLYGLLDESARGLLVTFDYDQKRMDGPPFAVSERELAAHSGLEFRLLERRDVLADHPGLEQRGLTRLDECVWRVGK